jgi:hypothetical protein
MNSTQRTIYSAHAQTCKLMGLPFTVLENSTLNKKFNMFPTDLPNSNEYPALKYIAIGNKGVEYEIGTNGYILTKPVPHLPHHASLYNFIPFIARPVTGDLSSTERALYRMRVITNIGGTDYVFYYLRVLATDTVIPSVELRNVNNAVITSSPFVPDISDLSPVPPVISGVNLNNPNGDYLVSTAKINFVLSAQDITEIMDACNLIYGDARYAVISEIALCSGVDKTKQGVFGATTAPYTESIATQIAAFIHQYHALTSNTTGVTISLDVGGIEPLLV